MKYKLLNEICTPKQWATISGKNLLQNGSYDVYGANGVIGKYSTYNHSEETVVVGCRGTCGSDSVRIVPPMSYINGNAMCFDSLSKDYLKKYFFYYLKSLDYSKIITGVAQPQITAKALNTLKVPDISKDRQKEIVEVLDRINRLIELNVKQLISLDELIKSRFIGQEVSSC